MSQPLARESAHDVDASRSASSSMPSPTPTPLFSFGPWLWASFGLLLSILVTVSGIGLVFFFRPSDGARSLVDLEQATSFGFLRDLHYWAGTGVLIAGWLHLVRVFVAGSYRRRLGWRVTVTLVVLLTVQAWLGDRLRGEEGDLAIFAAHILVVPLILVALVALWKYRRSATLLSPESSEFAAPETVTLETVTPEAVTPEAVSPDPDDPENAG